MIKTSESGTAIFKKMKLSLSIVAITLFQVINSQGLGSICDNGTKCPSGTSCQDYKNLGKRCVKLVKAGEACNSKSRKCDDKLRCNPETNTCYQGQKNDKQECDDNSNCAKDEACTRIKSNPAVRYCWPIVLHAERGYCHPTGRDKCKPGLECKLTKKENVGFVINLLWAHSCQIP